jgi:hypothetical protein
MPSTLIHEFGHALRPFHKGDSHSFYQFRIDNEDYTMTYNNGCNYLWKLGIKD